MSIINLPQVDRPQPLRPAPRQTSFAGEAALAQAQAQAVGTVANLGMMVIDMVAKKGQAEYNSALVKFKTAEMEKFAEFQANPLAAERLVEDEALWGESIVTARQLELQALPNTTAMRKWRKEYLENEIFPDMKSKQAQGSLQLKIDTDSIAADSEIIQFDYKQNKRVLADSYTEKENMFLSAGDRKEFHATITEAQKIGIYDAVTADDILDTGFALMQQNDILGAAMYTAFPSNNPYGNEKAGKDLIGKNLTYKSYDGKDKTLDTGEVNKQYSKAFDDQRNKFVTATNEHYAGVEQEALGMFFDGTLTSEYIEANMIDIPKTAGKSMHRYWSGKLESMNSDAKKTPLSESMQNELWKISGSVNTVEGRQTKLYEFARKNDLAPGSVTPWVTAAGKIELAEAVTSLTNMSNPIRAEIIAYREKGKEEKALKWETKLDGIENSIIDALSKIENSNKSDLEKADLRKPVMENANEQIFNLNATMSVDITSKETITGPRLANKDWIKYQGGALAGTTQTEEGRGITAQLQEYEGRSISDRYNISGTAISAKTSNATGKTVNFITGSEINKFPAKYHPKSRTTGQKRVLLKMEPTEDGKGVDVLLWNKEIDGWETYDTITKEKLPNISGRQRTLPPSDYPGGVPVQKEEYKGLGIKREKPEPEKKTERTTKFRYGGGF